MRQCFCATRQMDETSEYIDSRLCSEEKVDGKSHKLLMLGPGASGKSTIFKQLQWLYCDGITTLQRRHAKKNVHSQIIVQMKEAIKAYLLDAVTGELKARHIDDEFADAGNTASEQQSQTNGTAFDLRSDSPSPSFSCGQSKQSQDLMAAIRVVEEHPQTESALNSALAQAIRYIYFEDDTLRRVFRDRRERAQNERKVLTESTEHFWADIARISAEDYEPSEDDMLRVRCKTTGVTSKVFSVQDARLKVFDVGGQKSERKKWLQHFEDVKAVIFVVALSSYDEVMYEDSRRNYMDDAMEIFAETMNHRAFTNTHCILFLNKRDLFEKKITAIPVTECPAFADFAQFRHDEVIHSNARDFEQTTAYIKFKFESLRRHTMKKMYTHVTCATDRSNVKNVVDAVCHIVISSNLIVAGLV